MTNASSPLFRSLLFVPGIHAQRAWKALQSSADCAILDWEDAVEASQKEAARPIVLELLARERSSTSPAGYVRVNALDTPWGFSDLAAVAAPGVTGIVLPKTQSAQDLAIAHWALDHAERRAGLPIGSLDVIPIIETAAGLAQVEAIARFGGRVKRLSFGAGDFTLDLNLEWTAAELELLPARFSIVNASRAASLEAPIDSVWGRLGELAGLEHSARTARGLGFQGKLCIHPEQLEGVNRVFSPSTEQVQQAQAVLEAFEQAQARGVASIRLESQFIDYPIVYQAQRVMRNAQRIASRAPQSVSRPDVVDNPQDS